MLLAFCRWLLAFRMCLFSHTSLRTLGSKLKSRGVFRLDAKTVSNAFTRILFDEKYFTRMLETLKFDNICHSKIAITNEIILMSMQSVIAFILPQSVFKRKDVSIFIYDHHFHTYHISIVI